MVTIVGISGSLRKHSFNAGLLRAAAEAVPEGCSLSVNSIEGIPLYNADIEEAEGIPPVVSALKDQIAAADGLLLVTPENNNSMPGAFKNALVKRLVNVVLGFGNMIFSYLGLYLTQYVV